MCHAQCVIYFFSYKHMLIMYNLPITSVSLHYSPHEHIHTYTGDCSESHTESQVETAEQNICL